MPSNNTIPLLVSHPLSSPVCIFPFLCQFLSVFVCSSTFCFILTVTRCVQHIQFSSPASLCLIRSCWIPTCFHFLCHPSVYILSVCNKCDRLQHEKSRFSCFMLLPVPCSQCLVGAQCCLFCFCLLCFLCVPPLINSSALVKPSFCLKVSAFGSSLQIQGLQPQP